MRLLDLVIQVVLDTVELIALILIWGAITVVIELSWITSALILGVFVIWWFKLDNKPN